jgi:ribosomal protein S6
MKNYCLILVYKPTFTKEQVEEKINKDINEIFHSYGIKKINYQYCGNKLFSYIIKKFKSGHYYTISFESDQTTGKNITLIQRRIKENQDVLRAITIINPYETNINTISKLDANINQKDYLM